MEPGSDDEVETLRGVARREVRRVRRPFVERRIQIRRRVVVVADLVAVGDVVFVNAEDDAAGAVLPVAIARRQSVLVRTIREDVRRIAAADSRGRPGVERTSAEPEDAESLASSASSSRSVAGRKSVDQPVMSLLNFPFVRRFGSAASCVTVTITASTMSIVVARGAASVFGATVKVIDAVADRDRVDDHPVGVRLRRPFAGPERPTTTV